VSPEDRIAGALLGTAVGDALGLAAEGMSAHRIARRWGRLDRYRFLGRRGFVSDDTEQAALVAAAIARHPNDPDRCAADFRRALVGWFWRLPWGIGKATIKACLRATVGLQPSGVLSAGNGAAMRAVVVGAFFHDRTDERRAFGRALAEVTHRDERAVQGALAVAEVAARGPEAATEVVTEPSLRVGLGRAVSLADEGAPTERAADELGVTGFILHTVPFALYARLRHGPAALVETVNAGGDTDSIGAIVGGWAGALGGPQALPPELVEALSGGPFGGAHLRGLAAALARGDSPPPYSATVALARNLALYPVVLAHGFRRLLP